MPVITQHDVSAFTCDQPACSTCCSPAIEAAAERAIEAALAARPESQRRTVVAMLCELEDEQS
jgi:hypothetical protein